MDDGRRVLPITLRTDELERFAKKYQFTARETDVFLLLAKRTVNSLRLGEELGLSHHTVSNHLKSMFQKSKTTNKAELLALFISDVLSVA